VVTVEFVQPLWKSKLATIIKTYDISTHFDSAVPLRGIYPEAIIKMTTAMCKRMFIAVIFAIEKDWKPLKDPVTAK
jgi:hypothetical protein